MTTHDASIPRLRGATAPAPGAAAAESPDRARANVWLERLFALTEHAPGFLRLTRKPLAALAFALSEEIRAGTRANVARILGPGATANECDALARRVVENFILFCHDVGRSMRMTDAELLAEIERIDGYEHYDAARRLRRGAIVVTAHMGSFEVGMAALRRQDPRPVHVVFRRDPFARFERMRGALRAKLGVIEAPVDDGWTVWMRLRNALLNDEVVVLQGDRVMPGQKGCPVDVLGASMMLPAGPVKLALASGAPIVPVFCVRSATGGIRLCVEPAIDVRGGGSMSADDALRELAGVIGRYVKTYGDQWLMLQPAWREDQA